MASEFLLSWIKTLRTLVRDTRSLIKMVKFGARSTKTLSCKRTFGMAARNSDCLSLKVPKPAGSKMVEFRIKKAVQQAPSKRGAIVNCLMLHPAACIATNSRSEVILFTTQITPMKRAIGIACKSHNGIARSERIKKLPSGLPLFTTNSKS